MNGSSLTAASLAKELGKLLCARNLTLAVAESCTGGMIGAAITSISGSSEYFLGGVIAYSNEIKTKVLGVGPGILLSKGAVSAESVAAMARGAQRLLGAHCAISISGVAGPGGGTKLKPVGLVYVGIAAGKIVRTFRYRFEGNRQAVRRQATVAALKRMIEAVKKNSSPQRHRAHRD